ncbi:hypothetical protein ACTMU2_25555 [Cupriavidus basilensis]
MPYLDHAGARLFYTVDGPDNAPAIVFSNSLGTDHTMAAAGRCTGRALPRGAL